ncbi:MAG: CDP-alcohol phosphatidyltransferase family protein [Pseudomonadota bacterium]
MNERRPLASRRTSWASTLLAWLLRTPLSADAISAAGLVFAALGAGAMLLAGDAPWLFLLAALLIQLRLLANLMDGLVAVEGGRGSALGPLWNEVPDRAEDAVLLVAFGYAMQASWLGWLCACLAIGTAYMRQTGAALGLGHDFSGPQAKPQRMALLTAGCVLASIEAMMRDADPIFLGQTTLALIAIGTAITLARRLRRLARALRAGP